MFPLDAPFFDANSAALKVQCDALIPWRVVCCAAVMRTHTRGLTPVDQPVRTNQSAVCKQRVRADYKEMLWLNVSVDEGMRLWQLDRATWYGGADRAGRRGISSLSERKIPPCRGLTESAVCLASAGLAPKLGARH